MALSERENYLRNASFGGPEWIPIRVSLSGAVWLALGKELEEVVARHPILFPDFEKDGPGLKRVLDGAHGESAKRWRDAWGCVWAREFEGMEGVVVESPLEDWSDFDNYRPPDPMIQADRGPRDWQKIREAIGRQKAEGKLTGGGVSHGFLFMRLYYLRGFDNFMMDVATGEPRLHDLIDMLVRHNRVIVDQYLDMEIDVMHFGDDLGTQSASMISPKDFHKWITPAYSRLMGPCRERGVHVKLHSDGHILELADELLDVGVTILNPQDLVNGIDEIARVLKGRVCILLDVDRQRIIPFGSRAEIRDLIEEEVRKLGSPQGGLELVVGVYPPTPAENIDALFDAFEEFRTWWWD